MGFIELLWNGLARFAKRRVLVILLVSLISLSTHLVLTLRLGVSEPFVHDEFSYLLSAETFAKGRLSNPTHPMWEFFESFHIIHQPTYSSKYPTGQGLLLALGQVVGGHPIVAVWMMIAMMSGSIAWMLYGWFPPRWALIGSLMALFHYGISSYWGHGYMCGALPVMATAIFFGAWRRVMRSVSLRYGLLLGVSSAILAIARPLEGFLICLMAAIFLLDWLFSGKNRHLAKKFFLVIVLPVILFLAAAVFWIGLCNRAATGNPFETPYTVYHAQYSQYPLMIWETENESIVFRHEVMEDYDNVFFRPGYLRRDHRRYYLGFIVKMLDRFGKFYLPYFLMVPTLFFLPWVLKQRWIRSLFISVTFVIFMLILSYALEIQVHNYTTVAPLLTIIFLQAFRYMALLRIPKFQGGKLIGKLLVMLILFVFSIPSLNSVFGKEAYLYKIPYFPRPNEIFNRWAGERAEIEDNLIKQEGEHLVFVRYGRYHIVHDDWVYNGADIDSAQVVWARDMGVEQNQKLLEYYKGRRVWLAEVDTEGRSAKLSPYPPKMGFDMSNPRIELSKIVEGGPGKDEIPALMRPRFVDAEKAYVLREEEKVIGLSNGFETKAYPISVLNWHEVINDQFNGKPIAVTYCPLTGTGLVLNAEAQGHPLTFGVSGKLYNNNVLLFDRETDSLWSQLKMEAITGPWAGTKLEPVHSEMTTWRGWRRKHPYTKVLSMATGYVRDYVENPYEQYEEAEGVIYPLDHEDDRFPPKSRVLGVWIEGKAKAYPFQELQKVSQPIQDKVAGQILTVHFDKKNQSAIVKDETGSPVLSIQAYWFAWAAFYPETEVWLP